MKKDSPQIEFSCIGFDAFIKGIAYKGLHKFVDSPDKLESKSQYSDEENFGLCPECRWQTAEMWFNSITTVRQKTLSFETFDKTLNPKAFKISQAFVDNIKDGNSLILWSNSFGTGKTHLAVSIAREYLHKYITNLDIRGTCNKAQKSPVNITSEAEIIDKIRATFDNGQEDSESAIVHRYTNMKLLILDDVGKVTFAKGDFLQRIYYLIIDRIYNNKTSIVLTCNGGLHKLAGHIGEACVSRLYEMCKDNIFEVAGKDYRLEGK